jgi:hypothetical protein
MKLKYLITGTGRCGTVYMARLLTEIGISCGHEAIFTHKGITDAIQKLEKDNVRLMTSACSQWNHVTREKAEDWFDPTKVVAESSYMAAPYLDHPSLDGVKVIHLVRNPLLVLSSWFLDIHFFDPNVMTIDHFRKFILSHIPQIEEEKTEIEKAARYLIEWTKIIERSKRGKIVVRIEDYPYVGMLNYLEEKELNLNNIIKLKNKKINSWEKRTRNLTFSDIPSGKTKNEFVEMHAKYYGELKLI